MRGEEKVQADPGHQPSVQPAGSDDHLSVGLRNEAGQGKQKSACQLCSMHFLQNKMLLQVRAIAYFWKIYWPLFFPQQAWVKVARP